MSLTVSKLNVEKVEKPPQNPITNKYFIHSDSANFSLNTYNVIPRIKQARVFAKRVPIGNFPS